MNDLIECQDWLLANATAAANLDRFLSKINSIEYLKNNSKVITIAGTNGKGTTALAMESILLAAGCQVATYLSPHLVKITERCRLHGQPASDAQFCQAFATAKKLYQAEQVNWFEFLTVVFLVLCAAEPFDYLLIEVGIGGRHCVTNCIEPDISVVTTIAMDHCEILGETRAAIAYEKAGIFRPHKSAVCGDPDPPQTLLDYAAQIQAKLSVQGKDFKYEQHNNYWRWATEQHQLEYLPLPHIPLQNAATALAALQGCAVPTAAIYAGLSGLRMPGRMQVVAAKPEIICDVAHNPQACEYLAQQLALQPTKTTYAIVAFKVSKDIASSLQPLLSSVEHWLLTSLPQEEQFLAIAAQYLTTQQVSYEICADAVAALKKAKAIAPENARIIVFGSFRLIGELLRTYDSYTT